VQLLQCFDTKVSLYLYDPAGVEKEPYNLNNIRILATVSPNRKHYKPFPKDFGRSGIKLHLPTYTLDQLLAIEKNLLERCVIDDDLKML
jgi:hypothetical protein